MKWRCFFVIASVIPLVAVVNTNLRTVSGDAQATTEFSPPGEDQNTKTPFNEFSNADTTQSPAKVLGAVTQASHNLAPVAPAHSETIETAETAKSQQAIRSEDGGGGQFIDLAGAALEAAKTAVDDDRAELSPQTYMSKIASLYPPDGRILDHYFNMNGRQLSTEALYEYVVSTDFAFRQAINSLAPELADAIDEYETSVVNRYLSMDEVKLATQTAEVQNLLNAKLRTACAKDDHHDLIGCDDRIN